ncbi:MAG TPA: SatD family protein [Microlunatus sp.]|nr:SatD family protein [Microlunatus sp.]
MIFAVIGDLVGSRRSASRGHAQAALHEALAGASAVVAPIDRLEPTVGDEFQGVYATLGGATLAALLVRLHLPEPVDARCGIGVGAREVFDTDRTPMLQDGPAWWSARAAIEALDEPGPRSRRTWFDGGEVFRAADAALVNAFLLTRDALVDRLNDRSRRMLRRALAGASQREIAAAEQISESAVSQAFAKGVGAIRDAQQMLATIADHPR